MEIEQIMGLCRLCLANEQVINPIFDNESGCNQVFERINACLPINVSKNDKLPKSICNICWNKLDLLYEFRKVSVDAEVTLLSWVEQAEMREQKFVIEEYVNLEEIDIKPEPVEKYYVDSTLLDKIIDDSESLHEEFTIKHEFDEPAPAKRPRLSDTGESMEQIVINQQSEAFIPAKDMEQTIHIKTEIGDISENEEKQDGDSSVSKEVNMVQPNRQKKRRAAVPVQLYRALDSITNAPNLTVREASREFGIPETTLRTHRTSAKWRTTWRRMVFTKEEENELVQDVLSMASLYNGITPLQLRRAAFVFAEKNNIRHPFRKNIKIAGKDWLQLFRRRHPNIPLRQPDGTSLNQIVSFDRVEAKRFYDSLQNVYVKYHFGPDRIFNMDDIKITTIHRTYPVNRGTMFKEIGRIATAAFCMNALGTYIPPLMIFTGARINLRVERNGPIGGIYAHSKTGRMNEDMFLVWLNHFAKHVKPTEENPVLLILDDRISRVSLEACEFCRKHNVIVVTLPPHTSHFTQPLDVAFSGPFKEAMRTEIETHLSKHPSKKNADFFLAEVVNKAYTKSATVENAVNGFKFTGIYPLNLEHFGEMFPSIKMETSGTSNNSSMDNYSPQLQLNPQQALSMNASTSSSFSIL